MNSSELTLFFDGNCPLCAAEMARLHRWDKAGRLGFVDMSNPGFDPEPLGVDMTALNRELHSQTVTGEILVGIDSMLLAYTLVGKDWMVCPLRVKALRPVLVNLYRKLARHRYRLSRWMGYKPIPRCEDGVCRTENPFLGR